MLPTSKPDMRQYYLIGLSSTEDNNSLSNTNSSTEDSSVLLKVMCYLPKIVLASKTIHCKASSFCRQFNFENFVESPNLRKSNCKFYIDNYVKFSIYKKSSCHWIGNNFQL